ncbi:unnamed protein product [Rhizophagus irregularis]|nr:unnamed protein product [Rhizophagus irregularis]
MSTNPNTTTIPSLNQNPPNVSLNNLFASLADILQPINEPKCQSIRFVESVKLNDYIAKSYRDVFLLYLTNVLLLPLPLSDLLQLPFNPFGDPAGDIKAMIVGASPFLITGGLIQPLDTEVTMMENVYRQSAGQYKLFNEASHSDGSFIQFGFKEYVRHKIPLKRVINGAYTCYVDPLSKTYYYTTLTLDPFRFKVLKNCIIHEIISGKAAYIHSAIYFYLSMCTDEEDFQLMIDYGVIQWGYPIEGYSFFCELMKELLGIMYCWKFTNTRTWHTELVKIARWKDKKGDTSTNWETFAASCYNGGLLKTEVTTCLYKSLC